MTRSTPPVFETDRESGPQPAEPAGEADVNWIAIAILHGGLTLQATTSPTHSSARSTPAPPPATTAATLPATAAGPQAADASAATADPRPGRAPLIREGAFLLHVVGRVERDAATGLWEFRPHSDPQASLGRADRVTEHRLILLPSPGLEDVSRIVDEPGDSPLFEMTAEVFVYAGRNYILPIMSLPLLHRVETDEKDDGVAEDHESIERKLEERIGRSVRSSMPRLADAAAAGGAPGPQMSTDRDGRIAGRRGTVVRNGASGGWRFVFDADGSGRADPDMELLPNQALERLERFARANERSLPIEVSGRVLTYRGRPVLLLSSFLVPTTKTPLRPAAASLGK